MTGRPRHTDKNIEKVLRALEKDEWRVERGKRYFRIYCPCGKHKRSVALTPSDPNYGKNLRGWINRQNCATGER